MTNQNCLLNSNFFKKLIDNDKIDYKTLFGSWAGAFGYFQFMPSTIKSYAIDYDSNKIIDLKNFNSAIVDIISVKTNSRKAIKPSSSISLSIGLTPKSPLKN